MTGFIKQILYAACSELSRSHIRETAAVIASFGNSTKKLPRQMRKN